MIMEKYTLTGVEIDHISDHIEGFLEKHRVDFQEILRTKITVEETLLNYRDAFGEQTVCKLKCVCRFGTLRIELSVDGDAFDPFRMDQDDESDNIILRGVLSGVGMAPVWQYKNGRNVVVFMPRKKKPSQMVYLVGAVVLALVCGFAAGFLPDRGQILISQLILTPIFDTLIGLLNAVAGVMIFLAVVWGICGIGDMATLSTIGKQLITRMLAMLALGTVVFTLVLLPLFPVTVRGISDFDMTGPFEMILGIFPDNVVTPFAEGNFLQIFFLAVTVGIGIMVLGNKASELTAFVEQANTLVQLLMAAMCSLVPAIIFLSLFNMILIGDFTLLFEAYKAPLLIAVGCVGMMTFYLAKNVVFQKVKPGVLLKKLMPTFLIALTTASSSAAFSTNMECCERELGIDRKMVNFGVPLGQIIFGAGSAVEYVVLSLCMAELYGVQIVPVWLIMMIITCVILTVATPPVPGGGVALCTILFTQMGIPMEALVISVAVDVIMDFLLTATDLFCLQNQLVSIAGAVNMLDTDTLRSDN